MKERCKLKVASRKKETGAKRLKQEQRRWLRNMTRDWSEPLPVVGLGDWEGKGAAVKETILPALFLDFYEIAKEQN